MAVVQLLTLAPRRVHVRCFATPRPRPAQLFGAAAQAQQPAACALAACRRLHSGSSCQHPAVLDTIEVIAAQQFPRVRCESEWRQKVSKHTAVCLALSSDAKWSANVRLAHPTHSGKARKSCMKHGVGHLNCAALRPAQHRGRRAACLSGTVESSATPLHPLRPPQRFAVMQVALSLLHALQKLYKQLYKNRARVFVPPPFASS